MSKVDSERGRGRKSERVKKAITSALSLSYCCCCCNRHKRQRYSVLSSYRLLSVSHTHSNSLLQKKWLLVKCTRGKLLNGKTVSHQGGTASNANILPVCLCL